MKIAIAIIAAVSATPAAFKAPTMCSVTYKDLPGVKTVGFCTGTKRCASADGFSYPGFCPGGNDNQCCTFAAKKAPEFPEVCNVPGSEGDFLQPGVCTSTKSCQSAGGYSTKGYCPGTPADIQCCRSIEAEL